MLCVVQSNATYNGYIRLSQRAKKFLNGSSLFRNLRFARDIKEITAFDNFGLQFGLLGDCSEVKVGGWQNRFAVKDFTISRFKSNQSLPWNLHDNQMLNIR